MKLFKEYIPYVIIILVVVLFRTYIATPVRVDGPSMNPTLTNGEILLLNKLNKKYERMDIVVFNYKDERLVKRVIGLPGEKVKIENDTIYVNNEKIDDYSDHVVTADYNLNVTIPSGYYFVLGDNRYNSLDSRVFGLVSEDDILGSVAIRIFPLTKIGSV